MLAVAAEVEAKREKALHRSTLTAVRDLFQAGVSEKYINALDSMEKSARASNLPAPDTKASARKEAAQAIVNGFAKLGIVPVAKKPGRKK